jgi:hypothetical protein
VILGRHWKCWIFGHRARTYRRKGFVNRVFENERKQTLKVCKRGCGVIDAD